VETADTPSPIYKTNQINISIMSYKQPTPTKPRPLSEEEKKAQVERFLSQKRESFAINILCNMVHGAIQNKNTTNMDCKSLVGLAVEMADALIMELYSVPEGEQADKQGDE